MAYRKTVTNDTVREWRLEFDSIEERDSAFEDVLIANESNPLIYRAWKGIFCEYAGKVLFDDSKAIFIVCTESALDELEYEWEQQI